MTIVCMLGWAKSSARLGLILYFSLWVIAIVPAGLRIVMMCVLGRVPTWCVNLVLKQLAFIIVHLTRLTLSLVFRHPIEFEVSLLVTPPRTTVKKTMDGMMMTVDVVTTAF